LVGRLGTLAAFWMVLASAMPVAAYANPEASTVAVGTVATQGRDVVAGRDLTAWQNLEQRRLAGSTAVDGYQAFVLLYPESPFAVMAWDRLVTLGGVEGSWAADPALRPTLDSVRARFDAHQRALREATTRRDVKDLTVSGGFVSGS
jgi:hypothetical protein